MELVMDYRKAWHNLKNSIEEEIEGLPEWQRVNMRMILEWMEMAEEGQEL